jgi:two-component system chemotaxis response regulator CheB
MPRHAVETLPVDHCLPVAKLAALVDELVRQPAPGAWTFRPSEQLRIETRMSSHRDQNELAEMSRIGKLSPFTCPSCHGSLWEVFDEHVLRFRCHTGHAFSAESLHGELGDDYENALFGALRALEENARLSRAIAARSRQSKRERVAKIYEDKADDNDRSANVIRAILHRGRVARDTVT